MADAIWIVPNTSCPPAGGERPLTADQIFDVLDQVSVVWAGALRSLSDTVMPGEVSCRE